MSLNGSSSEVLDNERGAQDSERLYESAARSRITPPGAFYESAVYSDERNSNSDASDDDDDHNPDAFLFGEGHQDVEGTQEPTQSQYADEPPFEPAGELPRIVTHDDERESLYDGRGGESAVNGSQIMGRSGTLNGKTYEPLRPESSVHSDSEDDDAGPTQSLLMERGDGSPPRVAKAPRKPLFPFGRPANKRPGDRIGFLRFLAGSGRSNQNEALPAPRMNAPYSTLPHNRYDDGPTIRIDYAPNNEHSQYRFLPREQSIRLWQQATASSNDLDRFLSRVFTYFVGKGIYCIILERVAGLIILAFVMWFSIFLFSCVDYSLLIKGKSLSDIMVPQCLSKIHGFPMIFIVLFWFWWISQCVQLFLDVPKLREMYNFYTFLLEIPDVDVQSVSWTLVVSRLTKLPMPAPDSPTLPTDNGISNPNAPADLSALSIASRILRRENYWIPVITQPDLVDLGMPLFGDVLTKSMEWNLWVAIFGWLFDKSGGAVRRRVREGGQRAKASLVSGLKRRFILLGILNFVFSPLIVGFVLLYFFFKYAEQIQKSPTLLNMRGYSRIAKWKFREFNELPHYFHERLNRSQAKAVAYMDGFPKAKLAIIARFVTFISGSFAAVLALTAWLDEDLLLNFYITPGRSGLFYIGLFGAILAIGRAVTPDPYATYDPKGLMEAVARETHYLPSEWQSKLHADEVRREFSGLFQFKMLLFLQEIVGIFWTPWILLTKMPDNADRIVDFFVDNTSHESAVGWVCRFALFDAQDGSSGQQDGGFGIVAAADEGGYHAGAMKMEQSMLDFKMHNPGWMPRDLGASAYLSRVLDDGGPALRQPTTPFAGPTSISSRSESLVLPRPPVTPPQHRVSVNALFSGRKMAVNDRGRDSMRQDDVSGSTRGGYPVSESMLATRAPPSAGPSSAGLLDFNDRAANGGDSLSASRYSTASRTMEGNQGVVNVLKELYHAGTGGLI